VPALILLYHDVLDDHRMVAPGHRPYVLERATFRRHMRAVAAQRFPVISIAEWCAVPSRPRAIILTFDDGHVSNYEAALPMLVDNRLTATFFVTAGHIGAGTTMTWRQIRALHAAGMEIGSHTLTHRPPSTLDDMALRYELVASRRILEDGLGAPVVSVSSPTGFFNPRMRQIAREAGYQALCCGSAGLVADDGDRFSLNRVAVKRTTRDEQLEALLQFDAGTIRRLRLHQIARDVAKKTLGRDTYLRIRRVLLSG
jgi:peptidoglycan/xylan/chitin deacetylase (PgdA/CDA1 family)